VVSLKRKLYLRRRTLLTIACASPVLLLAGLWWLVNAVVLVPPAPGERAPAQQCLEFIVHEKGLPRLSAERRIAFVEAQVGRLLEDDLFRDSFVAALRRSASDDRTAFFEHVFDALKPRVLRDAQEFHDVQNDARTSWLDERLVDYKRLELLLRTIRIDKHALDDALTDQASLVSLVLSRTTEEERSLCLAYFSALGRRANEILQQPALKDEFEQRLGFAVP
jgi:hypothetical protein